MCASSTSKAASTSPTTPAPTARARSSEGWIIDDVVECNFHGGAFNIRTGAVEAPPCMDPLRTYAVEVVDGTVCVDTAGKPVIE